MGRLADALEGYNWTKAETLAASDDERADIAKERERVRQMRSHMAHCNFRAAHALAVYPKDVKVRPGARAAHGGTAVHSCGAPAARWMRPTPPATGRV